MTAATSAMSAVSPSTPSGGDTIAEYVARYSAQSTSIDWSVVMIIVFHRVFCVLDRIGVENAEMHAFSGAAARPSAVGCLD